MSKTDKNTLSFPQADNFEKVLSIVNIDDEKHLKNNDFLGTILGSVTNRQVLYYVSACKYLGLISKNRTFTTLGHNIRQMKGNIQNAELSRLIVSDPIFGTVYFQQKFFGLYFDKFDIVNVMKKYIQLNTDKMYDRRASTVSSWIKWVYDHEKSIE